MAETLSVFLVNKGHARIWVGYERRLRIDRHKQKLNLKAVVFIACKSSLDFSIRETDVEGSAEWSDTFRSLSTPM